jgi:glycosyltransferase involved in cell wall biosynthesis
MNPSVSIFMVTYNHGKYIRQAIESIVGQKTDFPYRLFIGEDFSTDNTRAVCLEMEAKYPGKIELLLHEKNIGALNNAFQVWEACIAYGKYTAICEGDDYWTDTNKLQKQVDFLEANPGFTVCCHRVKVLNEKNGTLKTPKKPARDVFTQKDVANHNFVVTQSEVFRNSAWQGLNEAYFNSISGDYFINMMLSGAGKIKYLPDVMAVYRQHGGGSWHSLGSIGAMETLKVLTYYLSTDLPEHVKENLKRNIVRHHIGIYEMLKREGKASEAKTCLSEVLSSEFSEAWDSELLTFITGSEQKERKTGRLVLKPYIAFRNLLSKCAYRIHRLKYE